MLGLMVIFTISLAGYLVLVSEAEEDELKDISEWEGINNTENDKSAEYLSSEKKSNSEETSQDFFLKEESTNSNGSYSCIIVV